MEDIIILIPALNPPKDILLSYIKDLKKRGFNRILIVDDGSDDSFKDYFEKLKKDLEVDIFYHYKNYGKGRALKNAFNYVLNYYDDFSYLICADSDGQHRVEDIENIAKICKNSNKDILYLGSRNFDEENVPFKSRYGNKLTSFFYKLMFEDRINDTQTGLRAISKKHMKDFLDLDGERFEYEINMLINASKTGKEIKEIPIKTVYFDNNSETHFNPIKDSAKIYGVMFKTFFKFFLSSIGSWLVDIGSFTIIQSLLSKVFTSFHPVIWISTLLARMISGLFNFSINKNFVFDDDSKDKKIYLRYFILWLCQLILSAFLVDFVFSLVNMKSYFIKIIIDSLIFLLSFKIQEKYIFN